MTAEATAHVPRLTSGASRAMRMLQQELESLRGSACAVLILGETGTGKSELAREIHARSQRSRAPLVEVNCAGLSTDFVQSELFGHARGAFTGAHATRNGLIDAAHGGTLFLDEIGDMDLRVQAKILKFLEDKRFRRMGELHERTVDVRVIAATHADLLDAVSQRSFRQDLFYRLSTVTLTLPPLRERPDDLLDIARGMLARMNPGETIELAAGAMARLLDHDWPGNLRELKNVLERALVRLSGTTIEADDLRYASFPPADDSRPQRTARAPRARESTPLLGEGAEIASRAEIEREHIRLALAAERGCIRSTARKLGIARSTLYSKLKLHALDPRPQP